VIRIGEMTLSSSGARKKLWTEQLSLPIEWRDFSEEELRNPLFILKPGEIDAVLLDPEFSQILYPAAAKKPTAVVEAGFADCLIKQETSMWLRCYLRDTLKELILQEAPMLDTHATCYLTGSNNLTRMCAVVAIQMGFRNLVVVANDYEEAQSSIGNIQKLFFDLEFKVLRPTELTLQPNNGSLLINTLTAELGGVIFEDLTYLNFLNQKGLVVNLPISRGTNQLLEEAHHVGLLQVSGLAIWGTRDWLFLKSLLKDKFQFPLSEFLKSWESLASSEF
jgi:hypothetical protein